MKMLRSGPVALSLVLVVGACGVDETGSLTPFEPSFVESTAPAPMPVRVFKFGPAGKYVFDASATGGTLHKSLFTLTVGEFDQVLLWEEYEADAGQSEITVSERAMEGIRVDSIVIWRLTRTAPAERIGVLTGTNVATVAASHDVGAYLKFYNAEIPPPPPPGGTQGCTPGYWKQAQHFGNWTGYTPDMLFSSVFEDAFPGMTLLQVVKQGGGGIKALGRHTVAGLLNGSGEVDYAYTSQQVISAFNAAYPGGDYEGLKNTLESNNEMGCPLGRAE